MGTMEEWAELLQITQLVHGGFPSRLLYSLADQSPKNAVMCVSVAVSITYTLLSCWKLSVLPYHPAMAYSSTAFPTRSPWIRMQTRRPT